MQILGTDYDFVFLPAAQKRGGILLAWRIDVWSVSEVDIRSYTITTRMQSAAALIPWRFKRMRRFKRCLNDLMLKELDLNGRRFTWSNERANPTMVRLDRFFCTVDWDDDFPNCFLQAASSSMSDHCPIVLTTNLATPKHHRFCFENFWTRMDGYLQTVQEA